MYTKMHIVNVHCQSRLYMYSKLYTKMYTVNVMYTKMYTVYVH